MEENINNRGNVKQFNNTTLNGNWYEDRQSGNQPFSVTTQQHGGGGSAVPSTTTYHDTFDERKRGAVSNRPEVHVEQDKTTAVMQVPNDMPRELLLTSEKVSNLANAEMSDDTTSKEYGAFFRPGEEDKSHKQTRNFTTGTQRNTGARNLYESTHGAQGTRARGAAPTTVVDEDTDRFTTTKTAADKEVQAYQFQRKLPPSYNN
ncbi:hypothetical protein ADEAN_001002900 [Angomonas deanei]|uniref:Uncharacterized protein n=1 Tax=Angomonas deanei TaxID=59799 RepID=A0A7G2CSF1_9TRYP|nr:hypothetical protein ADEAN_001002900 [Angomonas deanei]